MINKDELFVVSYGGGINSTAMLIELGNRGIVPDLIMFADTGGEKPETYHYIAYFNEYLKSIDFPEIKVVKKGGKQITLEEECLTKGQLPSIAYGFKKCSHKYKKEAQEAFVNKWLIAKVYRRTGRQIIKAIGYDAEETRRAKIKDDHKYRYIYPLIEWDWARDECIEAIEKAGLVIPVKSACFFCPSSTKKDIIELCNTHPELVDRALKIEKNAEAYNTSAKGLGRRFNWQEFINDYKSGKLDENGRATKDTSLNVLYPEPNDPPCGCFDG